MGPQKTPNSAKPTDCETQDIFDIEEVEDPVSGDAHPDPETKIRKGALFLYIHARF